MVRVKVVKNTPFSVGTKLKRQVKKKVSVQNARHVVPRRTPLGVQKRVKPKLAKVSPLLKPVQPCGMQRRQLVRLPVMRQKAGRKPFVPVNKAARVRQLHVRNMPVPKVVQVYKPLPSLHSRLLLRVRPRPVKNYLATFTQVGTSWPKPSVLAEQLDLGQAWKPPVKRVVNAHSPVVKPVVVQKVRRQLRQKEKWVGSVPLPRLVPSELQHRDAKPKKLNALVQKPQMKLKPQPSGKPVLLHHQPQLGKPVKVAFDTPQRRTVDLHKPVRVQPAQLWLRKALRRVSRVV